MSPWSDTTSTLCIGSGSGYFCCLVSSICSNRSLVHGVEINRELVSFARARSTPNITYFHGSCYDITAAANVVQPFYDRIYLAAGCDAECKSFFGMLNVGGVLIGPFAASEGTQILLKVTRTSNEDFTFERMKTVMFAPFVHDGGFRNPWSLREAQWTPILHKSYSLNYQRCVKTLLLALYRITGTTELWVDMVRPLLGRGWFEYRQPVDQHVLGGSFIL